MKTIAFSCATEEDKDNVVQGQHVLLGEYLVSRNRGSNKLQIYQLNFQVDGRLALGNPTGKHNETREIDLGKLFEDDSESKDYSMTPVQSHSYHTVKTENQGKVTSYYSSLLQITSASYMKIIDLDDVTNKEIVFNDKVDWLDASE